MEMEIRWGFMVTSTGFVVEVTTYERKAIEAFHDERRQHADALMDAINRILFTVQRRALDVEEMVGS